MTAASQCPSCGAPVAEDVPEGVCPRCMLGLAVGETDASPESDARFVPPTPEQLRDRFAQLRIIELIGSGGMGAVYKAEQPALGRFVALKILPAEMARDPAFTERFLHREARALARLNHPNIVTVHDVGRSGDLVYLVMELVDGVNLRHVIRQGELQPEQALAIVRQLCDALQYAHDQGVVHRDIKPENILLDRSGCVKVADFGLAKLGQNDPTSFTLTASHQAVGTWHYMAPEQLERRRAVDHRADIYSLGVVFYELLTGELPLGRFQPPSARIQLDVRLDEVVLRTLEKEPERRYQQASDVQTDVQRISTPPTANELVAAQVASGLLPIGVAFQIPGVYGGFAEAFGFLRLGHGQLELEFEIKDGFFGATAARGATVVPLSHVSQLELHVGWFRRQVLIQATSLHDVKNIPKNERGRVQLWIARNDEAAARRLIDAAARQAPHLAAEQADVVPEPIGNDHAASVAVKPPLPRKPGNLKKRWREWQAAAADRWCAAPRVLRLTVKLSLLLVHLAALLSLLYYRATVTQQGDQRQETVQIGWPQPWFSLDMHDRLRSFHMSSSLAAVGALMIAWLAYRSYRWLRECELTEQRFRPWPFSVLWTTALAAAVGEMILAFNTLR